jgi:hypothetical protein
LAGQPLSSPSHSLPFSMSTSSTPLPLSTPWFVSVVL